LIHSFKDGFVLRGDGLLPGTFVFPSRTQKAADENRRSQKPPAAWIFTRTFGKRSKWDELANPTFSEPPQGSKILSKRPQGTKRSITGARWREIPTNGFDMRPRLAKIAAMYEASGKIKLISDTQNFPSGFSKREFVVTTGDGKYPQDLKFEMVKDKCAILDNFKEGSDVKVNFDIRGNEYNGKYYVNLSCWQRRRWWWWWWITQRRIFPGATCLFGAFSFGFAER
jgi:hypothetical protein